MMKFTINHPIPIYITWVFCLIRLFFLRFCNIFSFTKLFSINKIVRVELEAIVLLGRLFYNWIARMHIGHLQFPRKYLRRVNAVRCPHRTYSHSPWTWRYSGNYSPMGVLRYSHIILIHATSLSLSLSISTITSLTRAQGVRSSISLIIISSNADFWGRELNCEI